jgi:8-oxo-dGTP diphosphatase
MEYIGPRVTVDAVLLSDNAVLLVKRKNLPYKDMWALPGGFVEYGETTEEAVAREVREETGIEMKITRLVGVYSDPGRDPRGHTISVVYEGIIATGEPIAGDDAKEVKFYNTKSLPVLAFDHTQILKDVIMGNK